MRVFLRESMPRADKTLSAVSTEEVRAAVMAALESRDEAMRGNEAAVAKALHAGKLMLGKKAELKHGEFKRWLKDANLGMSYERCRQWMRLSEQYQGKVTEDSRSVRQALLLTGILKENESKGSSGRAASNFVITCLTRARTHIAAQLKKRPIEKWSVEERRTMMESLKQLLDYYELIRI